MSFSIKRRDFLKVAGTTGLSLSFGRLALGAGASPRRVIVVYTPDGAIPAQWHAQGIGTNFTLPPMTQPLERIRQHCIFLSGLNMVGPGGTHEGGVIKLLTGTGGQSSTLGVSLDHYLGQVFKTQTVRPHLNLNIVPIYTDKHITYDNNGVPVVPEMNPLAAFDSLFGTSANDSARRQRRISALDHSLSELNTLRTQLGATEKVKLDTHLDALRELEQKLQSAVGSCSAWNFNPSGFQVTRTALWQNPEFMDASRMGTIADLHADVAVHALACDLTRVVTLKWNNSVHDNVIKEAGSPMTCHGASHAAGQDFVAIKAWYMERFARLIEQLQATPDGAGTLLDNTLVFHGSCLANGSWHNHDDMPFILAGGSAGGMATGRSLAFGGLPHNKLLVSIARFMGVNVNSFGDQDSAPGPLPGLSG
ncbi:MAG: DUF1552 domain-containing protein [Methylococcus sp.]|nr:DUF1552 domain-containing protein [Methylococcus sp.]